MSKRTFKESDFKTDDGVVQIIRQSPLSLQVCAPKNMMPEEIIERVNAMYPCGTTGGWFMSGAESCAPVKCASQPENKIHYVLDA